MSVKRIVAAQMSLTRADQGHIGQNIRHENLAPLSVKTIEKIGLLKKTGNLLLYKKSERICAAAFVVSDSIASESLRERVRSEALDVFSGVRDAIGRRGSVLPGDADRLALSALALASVLELACRIAEITESNYSLMRQECVRLAEALVETAARAPEALDPRVLDSGLRENEVASAAALPRRSRSDSGVPHRLNEMSYKGQIKDIKKEKLDVMSFKGSAKDFISSLGGSIEDRESKIIEIVKMKEKVSIKDISESMPETGEKTIQRALISLVTRGVLKKEGERRWSRYALAQATLAV
jgi:hypothetical protein